MNSVSAWELFQLALVYSPSLVVQQGESAVEQIQFCRLSDSVTAVEAGASDICWTSRDQFICPSATPVLSDTCHHQARCAVFADNTAEK